jgi:hypothetical protein
MGNPEGGTVVREPQTEYEEKIVRFVETHGCFIVSVFDPDDDVVPFSYSIGFTKSLGQPEVVLFGLPGKTAHPLINDLFRLCQDGLKLVDWAIIDGLVVDYRCIARSVDESWIIQSQFASALWYHRTQMNSALEDVVQIVWPDADGIFPWQEGCADWVIADQLALYEPRLVA